MTIEAAFLKLRLALWNAALEWTGWWHWNVTDKRDQAQIDLFGYEYDQMEALQQAAKDDPA